MVCSYRITVIGLGVGISVKFELMSKYSGLSQTLEGC
jgi:hypothetical protein